MPMESKIVELKTIIHACYHSSREQKIINL